MMLKQNSLVSKVITATALVGSLMAPVVASAYLNPEDVLLNADLYAPPRVRETEEAVRRQQRESAQRREEEWNKEYAKQHPAPVVPVEPEYTYEADGGVLNLGIGEMELLRTIRLLERIDAKQETIRHTGAPPLAPTGAGGIIAVMTMVGAVGWTIKKAGKKRGWISRTIR